MIELLSEDKFMKSLSRTAQIHVDIKETEIAIVDSISPLRINVEGLILTTKNLYINEDLLPYDEIVEASTMPGITTVVCAIDYSSFAKNSLIPAVVYDA